MIDNNIHVYNGIYEKNMDIYYTDFTLFFTFLVESIFKMEPNVEVMPALMWSRRERMSPPYTDSSQRLVGTSMGSGGSWHTTGKRLGRSTKSAHSPR